MNRQYRILLVEDSQTQALRFQLLFEQEGFQVAWAASAEAALADLEERLPDLIVLDYYLPDLRGDELCRQIRMKVNTRNVPILILTVEQADGAETHSLESGADAHLPKTVDPEVLLVRVRALVRASQAPESIVGRGDSRFGPARLLAIDDSRTYLEYLGDELRQENYRVETARNGQEGLERLAREHYDCVLVDLLMPGLDGIEVCRRISQDYTALENNPAVLMLTSRETKEDMARGLEAGADDFVGKSSDLAVLKARIRALLRRKLFQQENRRILEELKNKELEAERARAEQRAAEVRASMAEALEEANHRLKETQMQLVQTEKMASLGQLVAGLAHEINNPLAFVLNNLYTIDREAQRLDSGAPPLPEAERRRVLKIRARLDDMRLGLEQVRDLVTDLRTFSRLDEGKFKTVDIPESIESVLRFLRHRMSGRIRVEKRYAGRRSLSCYAGQLNQVLLNVVANAIDAIEGPGVITIATAEQEGLFVISVRDTGPGIPESIRQRIFEPFFTTKPVGRGMGLGLAICYSILQAHGGSIEVASPALGGAEFLIKIPLALEARDDCTEPDEATRTGRG
jgi:two-component system NtrC family sensor kinase